VNGLLFQWFMVTILLGGALVRGFIPVHPAPVWRWLVLTCCLAVWGYGMFLLFRGMRQTKALVRDLRPVGSWKTPFGRSSWLAISPGFMVWFAIWFGGILLLAFGPWR
jgi:hypothetical protein